MKTTEYFQLTRVRPDRAGIRDEWIIQTIERPDYEFVQSDGRVRRWAQVPDAGDRYLRVVFACGGRQFIMHSSIEDSSHESPIFQRH